MQRENNVEDNGKRHGPLTADLAAAPGAHNLASIAGTTTHRQPVAFEQNGAAMLPRITIQDERNVTSKHYLRPPPSDTREGFSALRWRQDIHRFGPTLADPPSTREREFDLQHSRGARPKEIWHRSRLLTAQTLDNREDLDDEFVPSDKAFIRVGHQPRLHTTPRRRRKIVPQRDPSSSSDDYSPPPMSSSRLQADFRDLSPGSEAESRGKYTTNRTRRSQGEETRGSHQVSRSRSRRESPFEFRDNSLHVIKTLKGWGLRYSGEEKESPEQFLSRLKACKRRITTPVPGKHLGEGRW